MPRRLALTAWAVLVALAAGCGKEDRPAAPPGARPRTPEAQPKDHEGLAGEPLTFHCAAGLRGPVAEAIDAFEAETGSHIQPSYAGSGILLSRIEASKQGDLFLPGDAAYIERAADLNVVRSSHNVCYLVPVILVPKDNPRGIQTLADLARPGLRLGLGNPEACAIGNLSVRLFENNHIDPDAVRGNLALASYTVVELATYLQAGNLDAAIVWDATAAQFPDEARAIPIPSDQNLISRVAIAVLNCAAQPKRAEQFARFLASERGQAILRKHHFTTELPKP